MYSTPYTIAEEEVHWSERRRGGRRERGNIEYIIISTKSESSG